MMYNLQRDTAFSPYLLLFIMRMAFLMCMTRILQQLKSSHGLAIKRQVHSSKRWVFSIKYAELQLEFSAEFVDQCIYVFLLIDFLCWLLPSCCNNIFSRNKNTLSHSSCQTATKIKKHVIRFWMNLKR